MDNLEYGIFIAIEVVGITTVIAVVVSLLWGFVH